METLIRIEEIKINGIKNVLHGEISFNEYVNIQKGNFNELKSILGIYGQNGSGKTTVLETTKLLKNLLIGEKIPNDFNKFINNELNKCEIEYTFFIRTDDFTQLVTYTFIIGMLENEYDVIYEKIVSKEYDYDKQKWKPQNTLIECENNEITLKKLSNKISKDGTIEMRVTKEIEKGTSFIFNKRNRNLLIKSLEVKDEEKLISVLKLLPVYALTHLIILENDVIGSVSLNSHMPVNVYLEDTGSLIFGAIPVNLLNVNEMPENVFSDFKKVIKQIDVVLNALIPSLNLDIANEKEILLEDGKEGISFEVVSVRNKKYIPLKYESEGIKRLISVASALIAAFNHSSICLMIDEFDSGIFEYLLGEIVEIIDESAKGQFVFTSHNLRALEKLSYKSILFTTTNPNNRYIQLTGVKPNNNIRDIYLHDILLGGQKESVYDNTKNYVIKRAFRGKMEI